MPPERQGFITNRIQGFSAGAGSVLIFEDQEALEELGKQQPHGAFAIPEYSGISNGMFQYAGLYYCSHRTVSQNHEPRN